MRKTGFVLRGSSQRLPLHFSPSSGVLNRLGLEPLTSRTLPLLNVQANSWGKRSIWVPNYPPHISALWEGRVLEEKPEQKAPPTLEEELNKLTRGGKLEYSPIEAHQLKLHLDEQAGVKKKKKGRKKKRPGAGLPVTRKERIEAILNEFLKPIRMMVEDINPPPKIWQEYIKDKRWYHGPLRKRRRGQLAIYLESFAFGNKTAAQRKEWVMTLAGKYIKSAERWSIKTCLPANPLPVREYPHTPTKPQPNTTEPPMVPDWPVLPPLPPAQQSATQS